MPPAARPKKTLLRNVVASGKRREKSVLGNERILLIDISNSFTKFAVARNGVIGRVGKVQTNKLDSKISLFPIAERAVISSVVPKVNPFVARHLPCPQLWIDHRTDSGVSIKYPKPSSIGADRLANAAAAVASGTLPAIIVDFGTAVTFDVIDASGSYLGGVIAPGLPTAAHALHEKTALLPLTRLGKITSPVGKSTRNAIRIGLLLGAVGLVREIVSRITRETFNGTLPAVIATGGDATLVMHLSAQGVGENLIQIVDPLLTLRGLLVIAEKNTAES
jgi:type III pantothenate kinase